MSPAAQVLPPRASKAPAALATPEALPTPAAAPTSASQAPARHPPGPRILAPSPSALPIGLALPPAERYRQRPIGPPGSTNLVDLLKRREQAGDNP